MSDSLLVTGYKSMDLDGLASAIAYAELLKQKGNNATPTFFNSYQKECDFVFQTFNIKPPKKGKNIKDWDKVILVDCSDSDWISNKINVNDVIEVIDHREMNRATEFKNARIQIERVGAAATLIAEKFKSQDIPISFQSAALLYSAIVSNTINFQATVTTPKDIQLADWLLAKFTLPQNYIHDMFAYKSEFQEQIPEVLDKFIAFATINHSRIAIIQLEIIDVEKFIDFYSARINQALKKIKNKENLNYIFITFIDLEKGFNKFIAVDELSQALCSATLNVEFQDNLAHRPGIIMRKQIWPLINQRLAN